MRRNWAAVKEVFWKCENTGKQKGHICSAANVKEKDLKKAIMIAWNSLVQKREELLPVWQKQAAEGDALQRYRVRLMIAITEEGTLDAEVPELTRMMLEEIRVSSRDEMTVRLLDGSEMNVKL